MGTVSCGHKSTSLEKKTSFFLYMVWSFFNLCAQVYIKSNLENKLDLLSFSFVFCFHVYLVFEYSMEFFAKVQCCSLARHEFGQIPVYLEVGRDIT